MARYKNLLLSLLIVGAAALERVYAFETSPGISVSASVASHIDISASLLNISDKSSAGNNFSYPVYNISLDTWTEANQFMAISVNDNSISWRLVICTDNFGVVPNSGFQALPAPDSGVWQTTNYGGLVNVSTTSVASMGWYCSNVQTQPGVGVATYGGASTGWHRLFDASDTNNPLNSQEKSFASNDAAGYTNIAYGSGAYTRLVRPDLASQSIALAHVDDYFYLYLETDFYQKGMYGYGGNICMELISQ